MNKFESNNFSADPFAKDKMTDKDQSINNKLFDRNLMFANTTASLSYNNHNQSFLDEENTIDENSINNKLSDRNAIFNRQNNIPIYENLPIMSRINSKNKYKNN